MHDPDNMPSLAERMALIAAEAKGGVVASVSTGEIIEEPGRVERGEFVTAELERTSCRVLRRVVHVRRLRNREHRRQPRQEAQRHLARRRHAHLRDRLQHHAGLARC